MAASTSAKAKAKTKTKVKAQPQKPKRKTASKASAAAKSKARVQAKATTQRQKPVVEQPLMKALRAEHRHMSTVMHLFVEQLNAIEGGELVDTHVVYEIMHYMGTWPDRFHHPREDLIYARVAEVDPSAADDVDTLQRDHDHTIKLGRAVLKDIERWRLGEVSGAVVVKSGRHYIEHIYEHMNVEEKVVFPRIEATLTLLDWRELEEDDELRAVSDSVLGPQIQREFRNMTRKLRRSLRRSVERGTLLEWIGIEAFMESLDVVAIAYESARDKAGDEVRGAFDDALEYVKKDPLSAPLRCAANNTRVAFRLLADVADISRETLGDLARVNRERKDRVRLLDREAPRR